MRITDDLMVRGLAQLDAPVMIGTDERSGFPVISVGPPGDFGGGSEGAGHD